MHTGETHFVQRTHCPACGSGKRSELYSASYTEPPLSSFLDGFYRPQGGFEIEHLRGARYRVAECQDCELVYQIEVPDDFLTHKLYDEWINPEGARRAHDEIRGVDFYHRLAREIELAVRYFGRKPAELSFFDFGMGWGEWCLMARSFGCRVAGAELSPVRIEFAQANGIRVVPWEAIPAERFDLINTEQVFEHVDAPLETLCHIVQALAPGGLLKLSVPDAADIKRRLARADWTAPPGSPGDLNAVAPLEHINCFAGGSLARMAARAGLTPVHTTSRALRQGSKLDLTLRDVIRPAYKTALKLKHGTAYTPNYLFFRRADEARSRPD